MVRPHRGRPGIRHVQHGVMIATHGGLHLANSSDAVVFVSGTGVRPLLHDRDWLSQFQLDPSRQLIGSVCSGALLLAALGLLPPKARATTYPTAREDLERFEVDVVDEPFVVNGRVATAAGCGAGLMLASWVISHLAGRSWAERVRNRSAPAGSSELWPGCFSGDRGVEEFPMGAAPRDRPCKPLEDQGVGSESGIC